MQAPRRGCLLWLLVTLLATTLSSAHCSSALQCSGPGSCHLARAAPAAERSDTSEAPSPDASADEVAWAQALRVHSRTVLGKPDVHTCSLLQPRSGLLDRAAVAVTQLQLRLSDTATAARLLGVVLLECDAGFTAQHSGVQEHEHACVAVTSAARLHCTQWLLDVPAANASEAEVAHAPAGTAFALAAALQGRVLLLQAHWQLPASLNDTAVRLPALELRLGASSQAAAATLGSFVGAGVFPPSLLTQSLLAFRVPAPPGAAGTAATGTAELACGRRCTYGPMGGYFGQHVTVTAAHFATLGRATTVALSVQRGAAGRAAAAAHLTAAAGQGVMAIQEPFQLYPGDVVSWRCTYDLTGLPPGSSLTGGHSSNSDAHEEQCTLSLQYHPRVPGLQGCAAALLTDALQGDNVCAHEAADLLALAAAEGAQFPLRRMYDERSFPPSVWMGGWKATRLVVIMAVVWATLRGSTWLLSTCSALGPIRTAFLRLAPAQQRNVAVYCTHLLLDTLLFLKTLKPAAELWFCMTEPNATMRAAELTYLVAIYSLELTWRSRIDTMLAVHHIGTIFNLTLLVGELTADSYRLGNSMIVLPEFALLEQPTYVALLLKRMLPSSSRHVVTAARVGYITWFASKGASVVLAAVLLRKDWPIMPGWVRAAYLSTWLAAIVVQAWSGVIQYHIYRQAARDYRRATAAHRHAQPAVKHVPAALAAKPSPTCCAARDPSGWDEGAPDSAPEADQCTKPLRRH